MTASVLGLVLAAAAVHAAWNVLLAGAEDTAGASAVAALCGVVVFAPFVALDARVDSAAVPFIAASAVLEALYLVLLARGYARAAVSFVYPIARGSAPVFVLVIGAGLLGAGVSAGAVAGVVLVAGGIVLVRGLRRLPGERGVEDLALACSIGLCIAGYTLIDKHGIRHASPLAYIEVVFALMAVANAAVFVHRRGGRVLLACLGPRTLAVGIGFVGSYSLVLAALRLAPAASVAAVRESGVVMATCFLALTGREQVSAERLLGAVAVCAGIALIALS